MKKQIFVEKVIEWGEKNIQQFPWRFSNKPYEVFIAEFLLKRTTRTAVNRFYEFFIKKYPNLKAIVKTDCLELEAILKPIGLYKQKAYLLKNAAKYLEENNNYKFPNEFNELLKIPGVGFYIAGAILSFAFGESFPLLDSNIKRVIKRVFMEDLSEVNSENDLRLFIASIIPKERHKIFNLSLIDLGSIICTAKFFKCSVCPISEVCANRLN